MIQFNDIPALIPMNPLYKTIKFLFYKITLTTLGYGLSSTRENENLLVENANLSKPIPYDFYYALFTEEGHKELLRWHNKVMGHNEQNPSYQFTGPIQKKSIDHKEHETTDATGERYTVKAWTENFMICTAREISNDSPQLSELEFNKWAEIFNAIQKINTITETIGSSIFRLICSAICCTICLGILGGIGYLFFNLFSYALSSPSLPVRSPSTTPSISYSSSVSQTLSSTPSVSMTASPLPSPSFQPETICYSIVNAESNEGFVNLSSAPYQGSAVCSDPSPCATTIPNNGSQCIQLLSPEGFSSAQYDAFSTPGDYDLHFEADCNSSGCSAGNVSPGQPGAAVTVSGEVPNQVFTITYDNSLGKRHLPEKLLVVPSNTVERLMGYLQPTLQTLADLGNANMMYTMIEQFGENILSLNGAVRLTAVGAVALVVVVSSLWVKQPKLAEEGKIVEVNDQVNNTSSSCEVDLNLIPLNRP